MMPLHATWADISLRLILTMVAGGMLGFNREARGHAAGLRTTILVALAASVAMIQMNILLPLRKGSGLVRRHGFDEITARDSHRRRLSWRRCDFKAGWLHHRSHHGGDTMDRNRDRPLLRRGPSRPRRHCNRARNADAVGDAMDRRPYPARA